MDLTKLSISDLFIYKEAVLALIEQSDNASEETIEELYAKLDRLEDEIVNRIDSI